MEFFHDIGGSDPLRPSLFELVAQEQLRDLLQPALKYVLAVFAQRYPRYLIRIVNRHEELYALAMLLVERHYLRKHNASFAENFYGLRRRRKPHIETPRTAAAAVGAPATSASPGNALRSREIWRSLVFLIGLPYVRAKAQDLYERWGGGVDMDSLTDDTERRQIRALTAEDWRGRLRRAYKAAYPYANAALELWLLVYNVAYLFDRTAFYRPWLAWVGVDVRRLSMDDMRMSAAPPPSSPDRTQGLQAWVRKLARRAPGLLLDSLRLLLPTAILLVKFLEWWYAPNSPARALSAPSAAGPAVPPPAMLRPHPEGLVVDGQAYGACAVCGGRIENATALPSGYVCCYRCAFRAVDRSGRCPITLIPAKVWQLRKVLV